METKRYIPQFWQYLTILLISSIGMTCRNDTMLASSFHLKTAHALVVLATRHHSYYLVQKVQARHVCLFCLEKLIGNSEDFLWDRHLLRERKKINWRPLGYGEWTKFLFYFIFIHQDVLWKLTPGFCLFLSSSYFSAPGIQAEFQWLQMNNGFTKICCTHPFIQFSLSPKWIIHTFIFCEWI